MGELRDKKMKSCLYYLCIFVLCESISMIRGLDSVQPQQPCPCDSAELCNQSYLPNHIEVTVITEKQSNYKKWSWDGIHNVIHVGETDDPQLMCYAHSKKANYGIMVTMPGNGQITSTDFDKWMNDSIDRAVKSYAKIIAVDLLGLVGNCNMDESHGKNVVDLTSGFKKRLQIYSPKIKLHCVMPWKPPCFQTNCNVTSHLKDICDAILTSPDSYVTKCDKHCRARATMPISNMIIGADEYLYKEGVRADMFYSGIPWHGYDYKCDTYNVDVDKGVKNPDVCAIPKKNGTEFCDFDNYRKKLTFHDLDTQYNTQFHKTHHWSPLYNAYYFNVNTSNDGLHQVWFESDDTLYEKYKFALDMQFRGVVIWTADDLMNYDKGDAQEWHWLMHTMMMTGQMAEKEDMSFPLKAAFIGCGCFIGGTIVGAVIATVIGRRQMKHMNKRYQPPFQKDEDEDDAPNFHEDDKYL